MAQNDIWVFAEVREQQLSATTSGLLAMARKLAGDLGGKACACLLGCHLDNDLALLENSAAQIIYALDHHALFPASPDTLTPVLQRLIADHRPRLVLFDAATSGAELAARTAWRMKLPCITEVKRIDVAKPQLVVSTACYQDKVYRNITLGLEDTSLLTFLAADVDTDPGKPSGSSAPTKAGNIQHIQARLPERLEPVRTRFVDFLKGDPKTIGLEEADLIVAGGKGILANAANLTELADALGASAGGTRPLVDEGIIPFERQIGITGKSVSPRLLFTLGVSGAREFSAGTEQTKFSIAINTDKKAPIFKSSDLRVHGDVNEIVPVLVKRLNQHRVEKDEKDSKNNG